MVYPENYNASSAGSREIIIDDRDLAVPFVVLVRHGSSDHVQPNFPTPGQIRSMFNTSKISDCPEYASSPSTMSDPMEWHHTRQVDMLEDKLMRIHRWNNLTCETRPHEGQTAINNPVGNSPYSFQSSSRDIIYGVDEVTTMHLLENESENQSEKSDQSGQSKDDDDDHREYDVEEYIEQNNAYTDASENSYRDECSNKEIIKCKDNSVQTALKLEEVVLDSDSFERQKELEKYFNLQVREQDNEFIRELKNVLLDKLKKYIVQKDGNNKCTFADDIKKVSEILNRAINEKDSVICDKVHELCLRLRDILVLKDEILSNATDNTTNTTSHLEVTESTVTNSINTPDNMSSDNPTLSYQNSMSNIGLDRISKEKITMVHAFKEIDIKDHKPVLAKKESVDTLNKLSRIPVLKNKSISGNKLVNGSSSIKANCNKTSTLKLNNNKKLQQQVISVHNRDKHKTTTTRYSKDILQQKEEILKKAQHLGLIDRVHKIAKVPHLTERAQLALLDKQIQGKLKNKQLALERRKIGLRDRISTLKITNSNSSQRYGSVKLNSECSESNLIKPKTSPLSCSVPSGKPSVILPTKTELERPKTHTKTIRDCSVNTNEQHTMQENDLNTSLHKHMNEDKPTAAVINKNQLNEVYCNCSYKNQDDSGFNENCPTSKLSISVVDTWTTHSQELTQNSLEDFIKEEKMLAVCNFEEEENIPMIKIPKPDPLQSPIVTTKEDLKIPEETEIHSISSEGRRNLSIFYLLVIILVVAAAIMYYVNELQVYKCVDQCQMICKDMWGKFNKIEWYATFNYHTKSLRKYVKQKCELL